MAAEYMRFDNVKVASNQFVGDTTLMEYLRNQGDMMDRRDTMNSTQKTISARITSDEFIKNIYIISDTAKSIMTAQVQIEDGFYAGLSETEIGKYLIENPMKYIWSGQDDYLDEKLNTKPDDYAIRLIRPFGNLDSVLIMDIRVDTINKILADLSFESGYLGFIAPDGFEVIDKTNKNVKTDKAVFTDQQFYKKALESNTSTGSDTVDYKGKKHLFLYSKIGDTGAMICSLMPLSVINNQASNIRTTTVIIVIIACLIAITTAVVLSTGINNTINNINSVLRRAAKGDLTIQFSIDRKDEFKVLSEQVQATINNMKQLIQQVKDLSMEVSFSSNSVSKASEAFLKSSSDISRAMTEIEQGVNQQALEAEQCLTQMDALNKKIELVSDNTKEIGLIADNTKQRVIEGTYVSDELNKQTSSTISTTKGIIQEIEKLAEKSSSINSIINVINDIANQTNLLSLNASIEASVQENTEEVLLL